MFGLIGKKLGMTRVMQEGGSIPATLLLVEEHRISQVKTKATDGYNAYQITIGKKKAKKVTKPLAGHFAKAKVEAGKITREFRQADDAEMKLSLGDTLEVDMFKEKQIIDATGTSIGKGFQGAVKRWNFRTQDSTHGNSLAHRAPGSIGQCQTPGRVFKGKKMAGQMGNKRSTTQNLQILKIDKERKILFIKGSVPGAVGGYVLIQPSVKSTNQKTAA